MKNKYIKHGQFAHTVDTSKGCNKCGFSKTKAEPTNERSEFTPGPWNYQWVRWANDVDLKLVDLKRGRVLAIFNKSPFLDIDEQEANARLIAAAPELLEAVKAAEGYLQGVKAGKTFEESDLVGLLKNAISKAEGGK